MKQKNIQKNLMMQPETGKRLSYMSDETGLSQSFITQYLIDEFFTNKFNNKKQDESFFDLLKD